MSAKKQIIAAFLEELSAKAAQIGYVQKPKNKISKVCLNDKKLSVRYEFFGSDVIDAVAYVGIHLPMIEAALSGMSFSSNLPPSPIKETIFQRVDTFLKNALNEEPPAFSRLPEQATRSLQSLDAQLETFRLTLCDDTRLAVYCLTDHTLPLGHHAFRVPFVLRSVGMECECQQYMANVYSKGYIAGYSDFINEFNQTNWDKRP